MCGFCIRFIDFVLKGKSLLDYTNLFSRNEYEKNDKIIRNIFQELKSLRWKNYIVLFVVSIEKLKNLKYHTLEKTLVLSIIYSKGKNEKEKLFEEDSIEILKIFSLV